MKTPKSKSKSKFPYLITAIGIVAIAVIIYFIVTLNAPKQSTDSSSNTPTAAEEASGNKSVTTPSEGLPTDTSSTTSDQVPTSDALSVSITSSAQSSGIVSASAKSSGPGTCVFTYQPSDGGKPVTRQVAVESTTCSVTIPESEFTYLGKWSLTVTYYSESKKVEATQNVTIN